MKTTVQAFLQAIRTIAAEKPAYRLGGSGTDGTCDCVGLIMGAIRRVDSSAAFPLHSSNYFARRKTENLLPVAQIRPVPGLLVYKARPDNGNLHARYQKGGSFFNGDLLDYYHIGVVTGISPLEITHCTSGDGVNGITADSSLRGWTHAGYLAGIQYGKEENGMIDAKTATIMTQDGNPLRLRPTPGTDKPPVAKMPNGDTVQVLADAQGWAKVVWQGQTGYCMSHFLQYNDSLATTAQNLGQQLLNRLDTIITLLGGDGGG